MQDIYKTRKYILFSVIGLCIAILLLKCWQLQVWDTSYQKQQSFRQSIRIYPSRGSIFDRNGEIMVYNLAMYDLMATYNQIKKNDIDTNKFCNLLNIDKTSYIERLQKDFSKKEYSQRKPFEFLNQIPAKRFAKFEEHLYQFGGFSAIRKNVRGYPVDVAGHILGYISEVRPEQIKRYDGIYKSGDYIGTSGLELSYEEQLRGKQGLKNVLRDKWGRQQGSYKNGELDISAQSGYDLISSLDLELQRYCEQLLQNKRGAIVAIEPSTGEILSIVSAPSYDPGLLAIDQDRKSAFDSLLNAPSKILFNRAIMAQYPPGSIFKPVISAIALQEGIITPSRGIPCGGAYHYGNLRIGCHGHGSITGVDRAIQYSCNSFYCQVFRELVSVYGFNYPEKGLDKLADHLKAFGLGQRLDIDIINKTKGKIPGSKFFDRKYGKGLWRFSNCVSMGIGQGELLITPLQMANIAAIIANRGYYYIPHFAKELRGDTSDILAKYKEKHYTKVHPSHFETVVKGMEQVVTAGTATRSRIPGIRFCGKTGTVENPHGKDHSTFIAFAPRQNPKIAIAVYVENGGYGSTYAAPIASLVVEKYLRDSISTPMRKQLEMNMLKADLRPKAVVKKDNTN